MPAITNAQMRKALTIVIDLAKDNVIPKEVEAHTDPIHTAVRKEQLKAIQLVEHLRNVMFLHHLVRAKDDDNGQ